MKVKALLLTVIAVAIMIICFVVNKTYNNKGLESEPIAVVFPMDKMVSIEEFEEKLIDLYNETLVKSETAEAESDIQEMAEAGEMGSGVENEEILSKDESTQNASGGGDLTATKSTPAPSDGGINSGTDGVPEYIDGGGSISQSDLDALKAYLESIGQTGEPYSGPTGSSAGENSGSNHGITMAQ